MSERPEPSTDVEFRDFFRTHLAYVRESLRRLGVHERDVEDLAHEVFLVVHRRFAEYDRARPARPWLFAFALRLASGYRQSARVTRESVGLDVEMPTSAPDAEAQLTTARERQRLYDALQALSDDHRALFVMHELDERPIPEIARELEMPVQTAYSRLRVARAEFVAAIRRQDRIPLREGAIHDRA